MVKNQTVKRECDYLDGIGTDIHSNWELDEHGDLRVVSDEENILQSIINRLNTWLEEDNLFYVDYGTILSSFLGWKREEETLEFIKIELENVLSQDPRLEEYELRVDYGSDGCVDIFLGISFDDNDLELSLVISEDGSVRVADDLEIIDEEDEDDDEEYDDEDYSDEVE